MSPRGLSIPLLTMLCAAPAFAETLTPLDGVVPQTAEALWADYDPRAEPLDVEILHEWEQDGVVLQVLRYRVGVFKGEKAMMAAIYGYPKGAKDLPALVQIHGGGQYADQNAVYTNAKRGYATLSIAWAGRINAQDYLVNPVGVQRFFADDTEHPHYKLTTDWGSLEGYHAPGRFKSSNVVDVKPADWTYDDVESPRNSTWFLWTMGARRGLTFLEQQPQVDPERLGVYGHSMGGKLTVMTAGSDSRVKVAAPSCGGVSDRTRGELYTATIGDAAYLEQLDCPVFFLSPSNDFHGALHHVPIAIEEMPSTDWRICSAPHHNHQDTAAYEVATQLWMDQHLKGAPSLPESPELALSLSTDSSIPRIHVSADPQIAPLRVEVYYTQQGQDPDEKPDHDRMIHRYWHSAEVSRKAGGWGADLPVRSTEDSLWVYANVVYPLAESVVGAGYYYRTYTANEYVLSTPVKIVSAEELQQAGVRTTLAQTTLIEDFAENWQRGWFSYLHADGWQRTTHKLYNPVYAAPVGAQLAFDVRSENANTLVVGLNDAAVEVALAGGNKWQTMVLKPEDFKSADGDFGSDWSTAKSLSLTHHLRLRSKQPDGVDKEFGTSTWQGSAPEFRKLHWKLD